MAAPYPCARHPRKHLHIGFAGFAVDVINDGDTGT